MYVFQVSSGAFCNFINLPNLQVWNGCSAACDLLIAVSLTFSVRMPRFLYVFLYFSKLWYSRFRDGNRLGNQHNWWSRDSRVWSLAQGYWQVRIAYLIRYKVILVMIFFQNFCTATIAIINLILFVLPGNHPTYYQTTTAILGKMYSNTMMVTLNSRITISKKGESTSGSTDYSTSSNSEIRRRLPNSSLGDITVTQEQWSTLPEIHLPEIHNLNVSMAIQSSSHWYWYGR